MYVNGLYLAGGSDWAGIDVDGASKLLLQHGAVLHSKRRGIDRGPTKPAAVNCTHTVQEISQGAANWSTAFHVEEHSHNGVRSSMGSDE